MPIISDIRIESSTFLMGTYSQGLLQIDNGANVSFNDNLSLRIIQYLLFH
jgi:hypothetical protein